MHVSELSWKHIDHPSEVVEVGDQVEVEVLDVDLDRERVSLSLKATQEDPWQKFAREHAVDENVDGEVTKLVPFGAFVKVADGIEGLVHISELAERHVEVPEAVVNVGDQIEVKVIDIDTVRRRISLSLKQAQAPTAGDVAQDPYDPNPQPAVSTAYSSGGDDDTCVRQQPGGGLRQGGLRRRQRPDPRGDGARRGRAPRGGRGGRRAGDRGRRPRSRGRGACGRGACGRGARRRGACRRGARGRRAAADEDDADDQHVLTDVPRPQHRREPRPIAGAHGASEAGYLPPVRRRGRTRPVMGAGACSSSD